jgi:hypothetical protein
MLFRLAAVMLGVTANLVLSCTEPARQSPARGAAQRNLNTRATVVTLLDSANGPAGSTRAQTSLSAGRRWLQFRSGDAEYSWEDLRQRAPDLINPQPWPGDAMIVVKPDPTIDYKIRIVKPDPSIDYKILIVGPAAPKSMPDLHERLWELLPQQAAPKSQKQGR